jgi:hypothetical protein
MRPRTELAGVFAAALVAYGCGEDSIKTGGSPPSVSVSGFSFSAIYGGPPPDPQPFTINFNADEVDIETTAADTSWFRIDGIVGSTSASVAATMTILRTDLPSSRYDVPLRFTTYRLSKVGLPKEQLGW